jgi:hypothetical protein
MRGGALVPASLWKKLCKNLAPGAETGRQSGKQLQNCVTNVTFSLDLN